MDGEEVASGGLGLGLLIVVVLLLCGNMWALFHLSAQMPTAPSAAKSSSLNDNNPEFNRLLLHDLILGAMDLDATALRVTSAQKRCLHELEAQIAERFRKNDRRPGRLDDDVRRCLSADQKNYLLSNFDKRPPPRELAPYVAPFHEFLQRQ